MLEGIIQKIIGIINQNWEEDNDNLLNSINAINKKVEDINRKIDNHRGKMMRDIITEDEYIKDVTPMKKEIENLLAEKVELENLINSRQNKPDTETIKSDAETASKEFIVRLVDMIVQTAPYEFTWHLNIYGDEENEGMGEERSNTGTFVPKEFRIVYKKRLPLRQIEVIRDKRNLILDFSISESEARIYKKLNKLGHLKNYNKLHIKVYC